MSNFSEYSNYDATSLAELVRTKQVSPHKLLDEAIRLAEALNPALNAVVTKLYDNARASIDSGLPAGPFTGVPFLLKEFESISGAPLTHSCNFLSRTLQFMIVKWSHVIKKAV